MIFTMLRNIAIVAGLTLAVTGCAREQPVYNVVNHPIPAVSKPLTLNDIQKAIILAGVDRGWVLTPVELGHLRGHIDHDGHSADIDVRFTPANYSISYVGSTNLLATTNGEIHRNYNKWIHLLEEGIGQQVVKLSISYAPSGAVLPLAARR